MSVDINRGPLTDLEPRHSFVKKLETLSNSPELAHPIESVTDEEVQALRDILEKSGFNLNLTPKGIESLKHKQFRSLDQGKGPAIVESLGKERAQEIFNKCGEIATSSESSSHFAVIGLRHTIGTFLALAVLSQDHRPRIVKNLNQRVYYGYTKSQREVAKEAFANVPPVDEPKKKATVPVGSIMKLWDFMTSTSK